MRTRICTKCRHAFEGAECPNCPSSKKKHDKFRGSARQRGYNARWEKCRKSFLARHPLCEYCPGDFRRASTIVDHFVPHKGDVQIFWMKELWRGCCRDCHDAKTAFERKHIKTKKSFEDVKSLMDKGLRTSWGRTSL